MQQINVFALDLADSVLPTVVIDFCPTVAPTTYTRRL
jgi:hypothetical protein